ncbi:hypothetical protein EVAR_15068_1 [Eumeta japonica]|uniref:Uncharacterized protein n=1 Tax=Eumeta variegata TaxID=151549 RepID=A0A4C1YMH8_EUMVA|nr:hypothetical protein EVAR_15068_1 [Eumeta japonica]
MHSPTNEEESLLLCHVPHIPRFFLIPNEGFSLKPPTPAQWGTTGIIVAGVKTTSATNCLMYCRGMKLVDHFALHQKLVDHSPLVHTTETRYLLGRWQRSATSTDAQPEWSTRRKHA